jgi:hypothetical protein
MGLGSQRGQALPAVLAIMLLLVLLAGGASMAISAVLQQQAVNRAGTRVDLSSQNAVAAVAANIGASSSCGASPGTLFQDDFQSPSGPEIGPHWVFNNGGWQVQPDDTPGHKAGNMVLAYNHAGSPPGQSPPTGLATLASGTLWSNYSVSVDVRSRSPNNGTTTELDAYYNQSTATFYYLQLVDGQGWVFGRSSGGFRHRIAQGNFPYDVDLWVPLELDVFQQVVQGVVHGGVTAKVGGDVKWRQQDSTIHSGNIAIMSAGSQVEADNVGAISQQRVTTTVASNCTRLGPSIPLPANGEHVKVWFTLPWPAQAQGVTVQLGGCPPTGTPGLTDCGRQLSTPLTGASWNTQLWTPQLTMVGADCTAANLGQGGSYDLYLSTTYRGTLGPIVVRWAQAGTGSVYMTVAPVHATTTQPYEESDILVPAGGPSALSLSYEGVLG